MVLVQLDLLSFSFPLLPDYDTQNKLGTYLYDDLFDLAYLISAFFFVMPKRCVLLTTNGEHAGYQKFYCMIWIKSPVTIELKITLNSSKKKQ